MTTNSKLIKRLHNWARYLDSHPDAEKLTNLRTDLRALSPSEATEGLREACEAVLKFYDGLKESHRPGEAAVLDGLYAALRAMPLQDHASWVTVSDQKPRPHCKYQVRRGDFTHTATPCYGMHAPWWVPMGFDGETTPVNMLDTDEWRAMVAEDRTEGEK